MAQKPETKSLKVASGYAKEDGVLTDLLVEDYLPVSLPASFLSCCCSILGIFLFSLHVLSLPSLTLLYLFVEE